MHYCEAQDTIEFSAAAKFLAPWMEVKCLKPGEELTLSIIRQGARTTFILKD
jgi:hypothetical protein